jgi:hypothetical protein
MLTQTELYNNFSNQFDIEYEAYEKKDAEIEELRKENSEKIKDLNDFVDANVVNNEENKKEELNEEVVVEVINKMETNLNKAKTSIAKMNEVVLPDVTLSKKSDAELALIEYEKKFKLENYERVIDLTNKLIERNDEVLNELSENLKIGSTPRMYEAYVAVLKAQQESVNKLMDADTAKANVMLNLEKIKVLREKNQVMANQNVTNNTLVMNGDSMESKFFSPKDVTLMLDNFKKSSKGYGITPHFSGDDEVGDR